MLARSGRPSGSTFSRRRLLTTAGASSLLYLSSCGSNSQTAYFTPGPTSTLAPTFTPPTIPESPTGPLWQTALRRGLILGAAMSYPQLTQDSNYTSTFAQQMLLMVPENELKWLSVSPSLGTYNFGQADTMLAYAQSHNLLMRGHNLVWGNDYFGPGELQQIQASSNIQGVMTDHITTEMQHYAGKLYSWDVVNEPLDNHINSQPFNLMPSVWQVAMGVDYITTAYQAAHAADSVPLLVLNEYGLELGLGPGFTATQRQQFMLQLLEYLVNHNAPIQVLGIEAHLDAVQMRTIFQDTQYRAFLHSVAQLGLKIMITELDMNDSGIQGDNAALDSAVADGYARYLSVALDEPAVISVGTWGLSDKYSFLNTSSKRADGLPQRPLPYDAQMQPTAVWRALSAELNAAPQRPVFSPLPLPRHV